MTCIDPFNRPPDSSSRLRVLAEHCEERVVHMVENLQFVAVVAYLLWCLCTSLSDSFKMPENHTDIKICESDKNATVG